MANSFFLNGVKQKCLRKTCYKCITLTLTQSASEFRRTCACKIICGLIIISKRAVTVVLAWVWSACRFLETRKNYKITAHTKLSHFKSDLGSVLSIFYTGIPRFLYPLPSLKRSLFLKSVEGIILKKNFFFYFTEKSLLTLEASRTRYDFL